MEATAPRHPYAVMGGGDEGNIHCPRKQVPRPAHLHLDPSRSRFCHIVGGQGRTHKLYYELHGHGPKKLILLMGMAGTHAQFEPQLEHFGVRRADDFTVCVVDNRGIGLSDTPVGRWRTTDLASDCLQLLLQLERSAREGEGQGWSYGVHVVGMSMGGMAAQELVLMAPTRFASLTLISTHAGGVMGTIPPLHGLKPFLRTMGSLGGRSSLDAGLELLFPPAHLDEARDPEEHGLGEHVPEVPLSTNRMLYAHAIIRRARKYVESGNAPEIRLEGVARQLPVVLSHYVSWRRLERLRSYKLQVLVISGEHDNLVGPWNSRLLSETLCGRWLHFSDAGHGVNEQHAPAVNEAIEQIVEAAEEAHAKAPQLATHRKALAPTQHPLQTLLFTAGLSYLVQRQVLRRIVPVSVARLVSLLFAAVAIRRRHGGFFAR